MNKFSRRTFLKSGAALAVAISATPYVLQAQSEPAAGHLTSCLYIDETGKITLCVPIPDMGQGMITTAAQMIAEELEVDIDDVDVELMPFIGEFENGRAVFDRLYQGTGGSGSTIRIWHELRRTAAFARTLLLESAARSWSSPRSALKAYKGQIVDTVSGQVAPYADFVERARNIEGGFAVNSIDAKTPSDFSVIGKPQRNVHAHKIVTGEPIFGIDADIPNMVHAVIRRCPILKSDIASYDDTAARELSGVQHVIPISRLPNDINEYRTIAAGVAVVADSYWQAKKAAELLEIEWTDAISPEDDTGVLASKCREALDTADMTVVDEAGDLDTAFAEAAHVMESTYQHPHWAHTCMEPHSCIVHVSGDIAEMWVSHQFMDTAINAVAETLKIKPENINAHFLRMGTGLGRKAEPDFVIEACIIAKALQQPVKVTWSREDEMEQDYVNPLSAYRVKAATDEHGKLTAWHLRAASDTSPQIIAREFPIRLTDAYRGEYKQIPNHISRGAWRGPHHNVAAWVIQSALDEMAVVSGKDRLDALLKLYTRDGPIKAINWPFMDMDLNRHVGVLKKVADASGFGKAMPDGWGQGIAVHHTFVSVCAHVVDVEMLGDSDYRVDKVTSAIDCGLAVNPLGIKAQVESGIMDGLCAAKYGKWELDKGRVVTNNFDTYPKMRINEAPANIEIHIMDFGDTEPRGTGEVSLPPIIPALTNAIFAASGKRVRTLPIVDNL